MRRKDQSTNVARSLELLSCQNKASQEHPTHLEEVSVTSDISDISASGDDKVGVCLHLSLETLLWVTYHLSCLLTPFLEQTLLSFPI